jgi:hypothetical protein
MHALFPPLASVEFCNGIAKAQPGLQGAAVYLIAPGAHLWSAAHGREDSAGIDSRLGNSAGGDP